MGKQNQAIRKGNSIGCGVSFKAKSSTSQRTRNITDNVTAKLLFALKDKKNLDKVTFKDIPTRKEIDPKVRQNFEKLKQGKNQIFISGKKDKEAYFKERKEHGGKWINVHFKNENEGAIELVDFPHGVYCVDEDASTIVYIKIPRKVARQGTYFKRFFDALEKLEGKRNGSTCTRGECKKARFESPTTHEAGNNISMGVTANRNKRGLSLKNIFGEEEKKFVDVFKEFSIHISNFCKRYIPKSVIDALTQSLKSNLYDFDLNNQTDKKNSSMGLHNLFPTFCSARNVFLPLHIDIDIFFSVISIYDRADMKEVDVKFGGKKRKKPKHRKEKTQKHNVILEDTPILKYFTFDVGHSVAMRSGDILIFNPKYHHCISTNAIENRNVYSLTHFFKSLIAGGNDNSKPCNNN